MRKTRLVFLLLFSVFTLVACSKPVVEEVVKYTVTFNSNAGSAVNSQEVIMGELVIEPDFPSLEGSIFTHWYTTDANVEYNFSTPVTSNITLNALWELEIVEMTDESRILMDIAAYEEVMFVADNLLYMPLKGSVYQSKLKFTMNSKYISKEGVILPIPSNETVTEGQITVKFTLNETVVSKSYDIPLKKYEEVVISRVLNLPFENLTTEYDVEDGFVNMYYEENGSVPYIKVVDFFSLLGGFIDPAAELDYLTTEDTLVISYQYYDEDEDMLYDLILTINSTENTISTNDPAFYWAYVYSTETNYGRHITYDFNNPLSYTDEGEDVVYDLDDYNMDITLYEDEILVPYYIANQLFAGLSYYNVYYNTDGLYGIYSLPDAGSRELRTIRSSSMSGEDIPVDLLIHTFNMLAFDLDNLYGLQEIMEVETYYDLLYSNKDVLLVQDPEDFDYAIRDLLLKSMDEPHTSYGYPSYFNKTIWAGPETNSLSVYGTRFTKWYYDGMVAVDNALTAKWNVDPNAAGWAAASPNRPAYWFLNDVSVVLSLDDFYTADIDEDSVFNATYVEKILDVTDASAVLPIISSGDKFFYYNESTDKNNKLEILVKNVLPSYVDTYHDELIALGYVFVSETTVNTDKQHGYYTITVNIEGLDVKFMVQTQYDEEYNLFYVGVIDAIPAGFLENWPYFVDIAETVNSDSAVYVEMLMDQIMAISPDLENVTLDLSWNTGGNVGALFRIVGFITNDPFRVSSIDGDTGGASSYYVDIDGIDAFDTLNWSLLITPVTFSAANSMATIFMENDLGIIMGIKSGGGACSITPILLPNGTAFTMSSNNISAYRTGLGTEEDPYVYHNTEFGIDPDFVIDIAKIYDTQTLLNILLTE